MPSDGRVTGAREEPGGIRNEFYFVCEKGKWNQRLTKQIKTLKTISFLFSL